MTFKSSTPWVQKTNWSDRHFSHYQYTVLGYDLSYYRLAPRGGDGSNSDAQDQNPKLLVTTSHIPFLNKEPWLLCSEHPLEWFHHWRVPTSRPVRLSHFSWTHLILGCKAFAAMHTHNSFWLRGCYSHWTFNTNLWVFELLLLISIPDTEHRSTIVASGESRGLNRTLHDSGIRHSYCLSFSPWMNVFPHAILMALSNEITTL